MAETQLITITDIQSYRRIDPKYDSNRLNAFISAVQRRNLRDLLGDALYYDFMNGDRTAGKYLDLLSGKTYTYRSETVQFYGLKPILVFWALAILTREGDFYHSDHGAISFADNPQQQFQVAKEKDRIAVSYMEEATRYANEAKQFLNQNASTYPLWKSTSKTNETEFITFKI